MNPVSRRTVLLGGMGLGAAGLLPACRSARNLEKHHSNAARAGGTVHLLQTADIVPNALLSQSNSNFGLCRLVFNTLTEYDHRTLKPKPALATAWKIAPDGRTYTLTLRQGVTFHDKRPFGPEDVVGVIDLLKKETISSQLKPVAKGCTAMKTGVNEVRLTFAHPPANVFDLFEIMSIVDVSTFETALKNADVTTLCNGTGPFTMQDYQPGSGFQLRKNPAYWKKGRPYLDGVQMSVVSQSTTAVASLRSGGAQLALDLAPQDTYGLQKNAAVKVIRSDAHDSVYYLGQNVATAPLTSKQVRQAIAWAIDRKRILQQVLPGTGRASSLPWAPSSPAYDAAKRDAYSYDPDRAKQMIQRAGATGATVGIYYDAGFAPSAGIVDIVQYGLKKTGLKPRPRPQQHSAWEDMITSKEGPPGLFVAGHGFGQLHPTTLVAGAFPFKADGNAERFSNTEYSAIAKALATATGEDATTVYRRLNDLLIDQQFVSDLVVADHTYTVATSVQNLTWTMYDFLNFDDVWLDS